MDTHDHDDTTWSNDQWRWLREWGHDDDDNDDEVWGAEPDTLTISTPTHVCCVCQSVGEVPSTNFALATWTKSPLVWHHMLAAGSCDEPAKAEFFSLCQTGDGGYNEGMKLSHKMLKRETGGCETIHNY